jgi:CHAT domain-containing protein
MNPYIFILILCYSFSCCGQERDYNALLDTQLSAFNMQYEHLMNYRGAYYAGEKITRKILFDDGSPYGLRDYGAETLTLFYFFEKDSLWTWLLNANKIMAVASVPTTARELLVLEKQLKNKLSAVAEQSDNVAVNLRGTKALNTEPDNASYIPDSINKRICDVIFPKAIVDKIKSQHNSDTIQHIIIVPALNIATIPLYFLKPFGDGTYLIDKASIAIAPSFSDFVKRIGFFKNLRISPFTESEKDYNHKQPLYVSFTPDTPLVVGNPDFKGCSKIFDQLPGAEKEAQYAAYFLNTHLLKGKDANKTEVLDRAQSAEFLYFATHGVSDANDPLNKSYLVLAGEEHCEYWTAKEIQSYKFKREAIVVLSACQSGLGKTDDAGIIGLGRGFIIGGAGNVVMSLWSVNDKSTQELMHLFIDELKVKHRFFPADNLRAAILKYKKMNPDPLSWAPFIIMGIPYPSNYVFSFSVK